MTIHIRRDDDTPEPQQEPPERAIVVEGAGQAKAAVVPRSEGPPVQTTWAMVACQCTSTGRSYQLAFRKDEDAFVLKSIDRNVAPTTARDASGVEGPFNWAAFTCPECGRGWSKAGEDRPAWPVILCSCRSLFCTSKGVYGKKGRSAEGWWWRCPRCGIDARVEMRLDSLDGVALKGK